jgi:Arc/MetJ family transcription regulator
MRTHIVLDDDLINRARELTGLKTKRAIVDEALRTLIRMHEQKSVRELRGKLNWEGNLNDMREGRFVTSG